MMFNKTFLWLAFVVSIIILVPLGFVWSLNVLFHLGLDYNFETWTAAIIFTAAVSGQGVRLSVPDKV